MIQKSWKKNIKIRELTKNEKLLLIILSILILIVGSYKVIITPQAEKMKKLNSQKLEYQERIDEINDVLRKEGNINKEWAILHKEKESIVSQYFPKLDQAQIIYLLNSLLEKENVSVVDMNFNRPNYEEISGLQVKSMEISIPYNGAYLGVVDIIKSLKSSPRKILLDNISMDMDAQGKLNGNMSLKVYSLEGIEDTDSDVVYIDIAKEESKSTPFAFFEDYKVENYQESAEKIEIKPYVEETLLDFENRNSYFLPSQELVKGAISYSTKAKSKKQSLRFEYNIIAVEEENRGYIDVSKNNILLKYPPNTIGIWIYSYDYSPATLGILFRDQVGKEIYVSLTEGIGWTGWKYIETTPPEDLMIYPLKLEKLYIEILKDRDDYGVLLMDKLEAVYSRNLDEDGNDMTVGDYIFHIIEKGDSIESISIKYYGSNKYKNEILKINEMKTNDMLPVGKVLVLKNR